MASKQQILASVFATLAVGASVGVAIQNAAAENQVAPSVARKEVRDSIVDATVVLKGMGKTKTEIDQIISDNSGAPINDVKEVSKLAIGNAYREPNSKHDFRLAVICTEANKVKCFESWAQAYCEPLRKNQQDTQVYSQCLVINNLPNQGVPLCPNGTSQITYRLIKLQATTPMVERSLRVVDKQGDVFDQRQTDLKLAQLGVSQCDI